MSLAGGNDIVVRLGLLQHQVHSPNIIRGIAPIALRLEIPQPQLCGQPELDTGRGAGDLARHKLETTARPFVIEENAAQAIHPVGFTIISGQLESCNFANSIRTTRMKGGRFPLWHFPHLAEHFARAGKVKPALRPQFSHRREHVMRAVNVGVHGREPVGEALSNETLCSQVVAFIEMMAANNIENARITFQAGGMQTDLVEEVSEPRKTTL